MANIRIASRYAKSLLDLATERGVQSSAYEDMQLVADVCKNNKDFILMLKSPLIKIDKKIAIIHAIFKPSINSLTLSFLDIITKKKREMFIDEIATDFIAQYKFNKGIETIVLTSSVALDENMRKQILDLVKVNIKSEVELVEKIDPSLIGGFILRIGDKQVDTSIVSALKQLKKAFNKNPYIKEV